LVKKAPVSAGLADDAHLTITLVHRGSVWDTDHGRGEWAGTIGGLAGRSLEVKKDKFSTWVYFRLEGIPAQPPLPRYED
jgi:hypothetical protein